MGAKKKRDKIPVTIRIPKPYYERIAAIIEGKPHYKQHFLIIDLIERGLRAYERAGGPGD